PESVIAASPQSEALLDLIRRVAPSHATVLIQGESGTGKEMVARLLHYWSDRVGKPFVAVNCKAFAEGVLESELFGHEKGAFTGAAATRAGCFERAQGGTLFLDEIGEVSLDFQAKLLRVLQEGEVLRVGGTDPTPVRRPDRRRHEQGSTSRDPRRPLPRGPLLSPERHPGPAPATARAARGRAADRAALPRPPRRRGGSPARVLARSRSR